MPGRHGQYPPELRERAVRLVAECRPDHASDWEAMRSVAQKLGIGTTETVRKWVRRDVIGQAEGILTERYKITAEMAPALLATTSQDTNRKLHDVAEHLARRHPRPVNPERRQAAPCCQDPEARRDSAIIEAWVSPSGVADSGGRRNTPSSGRCCGGFRVAARAG
jgi:transposase